MRACTVRRISKSSAAKPWIRQNEMGRIGLCWGSGRPRAQTKRRGRGVESGLSRSTTKVFSAYCGVIRRPPLAFQGAVAWGSSRGGATGLPSPIPGLFLCGFYRVVVMGPDGFEPSTNRL